MWESTTYTVSEQLGVVELSLLKYGNLTADLTVVLKTQDLSAVGESTDLCQIMMYIHSELAFT